MKEYTGKIQGKMPDDFFELYPPLGTPEAEEKQKERGINLAELPEEERYRRPSGKTGVAFGLVIGRSGGDVKIQDGNLKEDGISFRFHVGRSKRGLFESKLDSETPKNKWVEVMSVGERVVIELKYTDSAQAFSGELPANKAKTVTLSVPQPEKMDCKVFVRATSAMAIEVAIAKSEAEIGQDIEKYELE